MSRRGNTGSVYEDDQKGFDRPARHTRPRTKDRPDYSKLDVARVVTIDRGRYRCVIDGRMVSATKGRSLGRTSVIVGDLVRLDGDTSGEPGTLARVVEALERVTVLRRTADDDDPYERPIVANADQLVIVTALADPPPRMGMIDRILIAAYDAGIDPLLCLTKSDLDDPSEIIAAYEPLGVPIVVTRIGQELSELRSYLDGHVSVLVGHSGVGKSTLVNALIPSAHRATGVVNDVTGRGRHTSSAAIALELPGGTGWVVDTPGVRSFGLSHVDPRNVLKSFSDLEELTEDCPRGCTHAATEPECALDVAVAKGKLRPELLASFRRIEVLERPNYGPDPSNR